MFALLIALSFGSTAQAQTADLQLVKGKQAIQSMTGCFLVDYSYTETEALKPGYVRDSRVYDVNGNKSIKEWIFTENVSPTKIRVQHVMFGTDLDGNLMEGSELKHTGEEWEYNAAYLYDFVSPNEWAVKDLRATPGLWSRRITNLDDGLRYACAGSWNLSTAYPEWGCDSYSPIPGREYRDMGRTDYDTLQRGTRVVAYSGNWLERQANTKIIHNGGNKVELARELGKIWYVKLPDAECAPAHAFSQPRLAFWSLSRETWDEVLNGSEGFKERSGSPSRFARVNRLENQTLGLDLRSAPNRASVKQQMRDIIDMYRVR